MTELVRTRHVPCRAQNGGRTTRTSGETVSPAVSVRMPAGRSSPSPGPGSTEPNEGGVGCGQRSGCTEAVDTPRVQKEWGGTPSASGEDRGVCSCRGVGATAGRHWGGPGRGHTPSFLRMPLWARPDLELRVGGRGAAAPGGDLLRYREGRRGREASGVHQTVQPPVHRRTTGSA